MFRKSPADTQAQSVEIEIFRPGKHRAMNNKEYTFSQADAEATATAFDPSTGPVPVVVGHPKHDAPAYAWAESVFMDGEVMKARLTDIDPAFAEIVKSGRYKRISAAFYPPDATNNPVPGQYYLRHIGFLGAAAPAVKGLKPVEFAAAEEWLAFGELDAEAVAAHYELELCKMRHQGRVEDLVSAGKVLPWAKEGMVAFMAGLDDSEMVAFADGEEQRTQVDWFFDYLEKQPAVVEFGETDLGVSPDGSDAPMFAAPPGMNVDRQGLQDHARAMQIMREKSVSFEDALDMIHGD
ncbi:hypothetical protein [Ruegeria arenilitoris]|uniref:hypothetical protein n=1 Tax=Ruegeria arenilitoris TaxID=1173585 RepID=UPI0014819446|nr:hypothetical protein [Ruegeria arenilitoris]